MRRPLAFTLALFAAALLAVLVRYAPPAPASLDAPRERFSAARARNVQERLVDASSASRPTATRSVGTEGNARGTDIIRDYLAKFGISVELQRTMSCTYHGMCAPVTNLIARIPGQDPSAPAVLVSAHHDSVPVSPGASDDGLGVAAVVETARALVEGPRPRRSVIVLLTDGEEAGLLGADAFVRAYPLARAAAATVNVDARGSHGPSQMFETSRGNAWLVSLMAAHLDRPVTTSVFYEVYKRMPNDTDFSITKRIASGLNFANTAGIEHYHTPLDRMDVSDPGTLQHHGDSVLAMTRAFAESDLSAAESARRGEPGPDAVWFDVLALGVVHWPERWSLPIALVALALVVVHALRGRALLRASGEGRRLDPGLFVLFPAIATAVIGALVAGFVLKASGALPSLWVAHPAPSLVAIHGAAAAGGVGTAMLFARRSTPRALWAGTWIGWAVVGVILAIEVPGMSYLFTVPALAAGVAGGLPLAVACVVPGVVAAPLVFALGIGVYDALGFGVAPLVALSTVLLGTTIAPMLAGLPALARRAPAGLGAVAAVACIVALLVPKFSRERPQRVNVVFRQDEGRARIFADTTWGASVWGEPPSAMLAAIGPSSGREPSLPWTFPAPFVEALPVDLTPPLVDVASARDEGGRRHIRARVRSERGASAMALVLPLERHVDVTVEGQRAVPRVVGDRAIVGLLAVPREGFAIDLDAAGPEPLPATVLDRSSGVPPGTKADDAVRARPAEAAPSQDGDVTVVTKAIVL